MKKAFRVFVFVLTIVGGSIFSRIVFPKIEPYLPVFLSNGFMGLILRAVFVVLFVIVVVALLSFILFAISWAIEDDTESDQPSKTKPARKQSSLKKPKKLEDEKMPWEL